MSDPKEKNVVSLSGQPIYHHNEPAPFEVPRGGEFTEEIARHIERHLGAIDTVFHEIVSDTVHVDINIILPNQTCNEIRLVTSGMSELPMSVPEGCDYPAFAELMVTLPPYWKLDQQSWRDEIWYWPVRLLKSLARLPHKHNTWLGFGHTMPNGDPAEPYAANTLLAGAVIVSPTTAPLEFTRLSIPGVKDIEFYAVVPLYEEEMELKLRKGADDLLEKLDCNEIDDEIRIDRKNVAKR